MSHVLDTNVTGTGFVDKTVLTQHMTTAYRRQVHACRQWRPSLHHMQAASSHVLPDVAVLYN